MSELALRWIITIFFAASIAAYLYVVVAHYRRWPDTVSHLLHLAMSAAMITMAWDAGMNLPTAAAITFFLLACLWFARGAGRTSMTTGERLTNGYYAVMMAAMAWMFAVMNVSLRGRISRPSDDARSAALAMNMSENDMASAHHRPAAGFGDGWIAAVNWLATLGFAAVALYWACQYLARRRRNRGPRNERLAHLEPLHHVCAAAGTAVMFGTLL